MSDNDSQLTAYLLGELSPVESAALEQQLAASPELQQDLDALRQTVTALQSAFAQHVDTQPAVPAIDRERLHSLLRSAVVAGAVTRNVERTPTSVPPGPGGPGYGSTGHGSTVAAPALLASTTPTRGSNSRSWLVAGAVLVVGGLIGLSQWEVSPREQSLARVQSGPRNRELLELRNSTVTNGRGAEPLSRIELQSERETQMALALTKSKEALFRSTTTPGPTDEAALHASHGTVAAQPVDSPPVRSLSTVGSPAASTPFGTVVLSDGASPTVDAYAIDTDVRFALPAIGEADYSYATNDGTTAYFRNSGVIHDRFGRESALGLHSAFGGRASGRNANPEQLGDTDGGALLNFSIQPSNSFVESEYAEVAVSRARGMSLQRGEAEPDPQSLDLLTDLSVADGRDSTHLHRRFFNLSGELPALTTRVLLSEAKEERLEQLSEEGDHLSAAHSASSLPPSLTVADYEEGFVQLGNAVKGWDEFNQHWSRQQGDQLSRGTQPTPQDESAPATTDFIEVTTLSKLVAEQQSEFKTLREKTPGIEGKPLTDVAPEVAKNAELALLRVRRELAREQAVWYYREGYVRQLEATLAAAEQYAHVPENDFTTPEAQPLSTFGIDVDTASYSNVRRFVEAGQLPPPDAVRIEELINSFQYEGPKVEGEAPLAVAAEVSVCPWQPQHQLLRVALKGKSIDLQQRPPARLVFLVDTSGSMSDENKLPLVKQSLRILVEQMREQDRLSIVTYSDNAGLLLDSTGGDKREVILAAIEGLNADGSTNGEAGLKLAYEVAVKQFGEGATNRVMLCTDGDFNVGESADSELVKLIEKQRQTGVFLNIFGFGSGNLKDAKLEAIADKGNGQYIYIDGIKEARKTLLNELTGTLYTIAKDVKLQIEFNPNLVGSYRLVGYENRVMAAKDFSNDKVDSGDMGAGHSVVALYEIVPLGAVQPVVPKEEVEPLKYKRAGSVSARSGDKAPAATLTPSPSPGGRGEPVGAPVVADAALPAALPADPLASELCTIRVRYKQPTSNESTKIETVIHDPNLLLGGLTRPTSRDHIWATAVAEFGLVAKHSSFVGTGNYSQVLELAQSAIGDDPTGQRREFVTLVRQTQSLSFERERQLAEISRQAEQHRRVINEIKTVEKAPDLMTKASCSGKYQTLLRQIEVPDDQPTYGEFKDFGRWDGHAYKTHQNLPSGYWVYAAPHWYIWGESTEQAAVDSAK